MLSKYDAETKIWHGPKIPYPFPMDVTLGEIVLKNLSKNPNRILQIDAVDDTALSCDQLRISSIRVAQHLQNIGIQEDDVVGLITQHSHFTTCFITGCVLVGCILNPLDGRMDEEDIFHVYSESKPKIIVCDGEVISKLQNALKNVVFNYRIYQLSRDCDDAASTIHLSAKNFLKPTGIEDNFKCPKFSKPSDEKLLTILCSSGTSGKPKSVCASHASAISAFSLAALSSRPTPTTAILFSPLFWISGYLHHILVSFTQNETRIWTARKFCTETFVELVEKYQITKVFLAPYALNTLLKSHRFLASKNQSLQNFSIAGAILSEEARKLFDSLLPSRNLTISYGMTEAFATITKPFEYRQSLSVGSMIFPNISLKIIDDNGNAVANGKTGEICIRPSLKFLVSFSTPCKRLLFN